MDGTLQSRVLLIISDPAYEAPCGIGSAANNIVVAVTRSILSKRASSLAAIFAAERCLDLEDVDLDIFDVLLLPDGLGNPHRRDYDPAVVAAVRHFLFSGKKIAAKPFPSF